MTLESPFHGGHLSVRPQRTGQGLGRLRSEAGADGQLCASAWRFSWLSLLNVTLGLFFESIRILCACLEVLNHFFALDAQGTAVPVLWLFLCGRQTGQPQDAASEDNELACGACLPGGVTSLQDI